MLDFLPALLVDLAIYLVNFTLQHVLADRLGRGPEAEIPLAVFSACYTSAYVLGTLTVGPLSDRPGWRRPSMAVGLLVTAIVPAFMLGEPPSWALFAAIAVLGGGSAFFWPAQQARIGDRSGPAELPPALARFNVGWTAGKALGLFLAGVLYESGPRWALLAATAAGFVALACQVFDRAPEVERREAVSLSQQRKKRGFLVAALAVNFALWGLQNTVIALIPVLGKEISLGDQGQGMLTSALVFGQSAVFLLLGGRKEWTYRRLPVVLVPLLGALAAALVFVAQGPSWAVVGSLAAGALGGCSYAFSLFYSLDFDERRGFRMSVNEAILGLGGLLPLGGSAIAHATGASRAPYVFAGAVCLACFALASFSLRGNGE